jgi:protein-disulfide isomerase
MTRLAHGFILLVVFGVLGSRLPAQAQSLRSDIESVVHDYLAEHPEDVQRIVKDYLGAHPEVLQEALSELMKKRSPGVAGNPVPDRTTAIKNSAGQLLTSKHQVTLGDPQGDVSVVEFFDYNCGFSKRALADMLVLMRDDPKLKIVLKEFPILGPGSLEAAQVAIAVRMQDGSGGKYLAFHRKLLDEAGPANKSRALAAAADAGLDVKRIEQDIASGEVAATLEENRKLARALEINGTPAYVIGNTLVPGAVGATALKEKIKLARGN